MFYSHALGLCNAVDAQTGLKLPQNFPAFTIFPIKKFLLTSANQKWISATYFGKFYFLRLVRFSALNKKMFIIKRTSLCLQFTPKMFVVLGPSELI